MTGMLASVKDVMESEMAIHAGVDIVDIKDPASGALSALPRRQIASIVSRVAGRRPVSATLGDLPADIRLLHDAMRRSAATGVDYIKVGVFSSEHIEACLQAGGQLRSGTALVAVLFADRDPPLHPLPRFGSAGFTGVMLDTADKLRGGLLNNLDLHQLREFIDQARAQGLLCGLAGSLRLLDIPPLLALAPDYLGFRAALCRERQRRQQLDPERLNEVRLAISPVTPPIAQATRRGRHP